MTLTAVALAVLTLGAGTHAPRALEAQELPPQPPRATTPELPPVTISPRGAFIRAVVLPGWGHAAIGAHTRGGFYFVAETAAAYTLLRTRLRLAEVDERITFREEVLLARTAEAGITEQEEIDQVLDGDAALSDLRALRESRGAQQEDMVALGIFLLFLSGADAYVSAHLSRFPVPIAVQAESLGSGRVELGLRLKLPN